MLAALFAKPTEERSAANSTWGVWPGDSPQPNTTVYSPTSAMQLLAVSGCIRLISESIATLPLDVYREKNGVKTEMGAPSWLKQPTMELDTVGFLGQIMTSLLTAGNAYCAVTRTGNTIVEVVPVDPSLLEVRRVGQVRRYFVNGREYPGEILHIPGMMLPGADVGLSPLDYARVTIGVGLEAQTFARDQFENMLNMPGVIEMPNVAQPDQMREMARLWKQFRAKKNRGTPGVLSGGATFKPTSISNEAAQFLQSQQWTAAQIAAMVYMVDPSDIGIPVGGTTLTYANLEQRNLRRVQVTLLPWIVRVEKALSTLLPSPQYVKLNVDGLLRADSAARWSTYKTAAEINQIATATGQPPVLLTAEMREFEDLNKLDAVPDPPAPAPVAQMNAATPVNVTVHMPESRSEAPNVFVTNDVHVPEQRTPDIHIEPPGVVVDVHGTTVNVPPPEVRVEIMHPDPPTITRTVERDEEGRIARTIDEVTR